MALTEFQRGICRLIAAQRVAQGESYVAGGVALNTVLAAPRLSRVIDLFHDTDEALAATYAVDRQLLESHQYQVEVIRERIGFVEAVVRRQQDSVLLQWARDSAYRFFPLVEHADFGLVLHPYDLATNKVLALVGRLEARDWVDLIHCAERIQPLGYLVWGACGKDPGFSPRAILEQAGRTSRYSAAELAALAFAGPAPDAADLSQRWHRLLQEAADIVRTLPPDEVGRGVVDRAGALFTGNLASLRRALARQDVRFHAGSVRGALPRLLPNPPSAS
ncbi:hypothetical protein HQ590_07330 [bacterium]|nr:hypothetical protein [bacterium]